MKLKLFILFLGFLIITFLLGNYYRPYVYSNHIDDFGLADVGYNIIAVVNMSLFSWIGIYKYTNNKLIDVCINTLIYLLIELLSFFLPVFGIFDFKDCVAIIVSGFISTILLRLLFKDKHLSTLNDF